MQGTMMVIIRKTTMNITTLVAMNQNIDKLIMMPLKKVNLK